MLTQETKRHIDAARQVLVGVVPNPTSQIDQITNALIYKFMDDMDQSAIKRGDKPSFFVGDLEKYAWTRLMDSRIGNQERMNIYSEALSKFSESKKLPDLFRDVFKSAFLPYRSPEVLGLFLKEISYFDYKHSEELGNAYEYLLSIMSSQGDAGQFRTPRHIIDFIVAVVDPKKDDKILDPACGTAGFLISAYNHILSKHDGVDQKSKKNNEKELTPDDRKRLYNNFEGYDIDPGMVRISQVNMYLHRFKNPKIYQYDTLSMDDKWKDKFDVILANPPFMSPKGGVATHNKFSIESTRSEVLFVDYIMSHLKPNGRAGIIVPEGIIFQSGTAHKQLRKNLVEDGLYAVVSLPSGVFAPYSGVKTSILLFNNELAQITKEILFVKIENDGFDLGATKRSISKNDLPTALEVLNKWREGKKAESKLTVYVERAKIAESGDYNLSGDRYHVATDYSNAKWPKVELGEVAEVLKGSAITKADTKEGNVPVIAGGQEPAYYHNESNRTGDVITVSASGAYAGFVNYFTIPIFASDCSTIQTKDQNLVSTRYLFSVLKGKQEDIYAFQQGGGQPHVYAKDLKTIKIPLPPLEVQKQIVEELDGYSGIIAGARQVAKNWKSVFIQDSSWELRKLSDIADFQEGPGIMAIDFQEKGVPLVRLKGLTDNYASLEGCNFLDPKKVEKKWGHFKLKLGDLLLSTSGSLGKVSEVGTGLVGSVAYTGIIRFRPKNQKIDVGFLKYFLMSKYFINQAHSASTGVTLKHFGPTHLNKMKIMVPPLEIQKQIVKSIESERILVEASKKLIDIYEQKTIKVIEGLWS